MTDETKQPTQQKFEWIEGEYEVPEIYGNFLNCSWTLVDVRFQIGQLVPKSPGDISGGFVVQERGFVTMAWHQAKVLRDLVISLVASYEQENGEIKMPKLAPIPPNPIPMATSDSDGKREPTRN
jgi:hypothetical protein